MKPANWDQMTDKQKKEYAMRLLESKRGEFILSQALYLGAKTLRNVQAPYTEVSNAEDMDILQEVFSLYGMFKGIEEQVKIEFGGNPGELVKKP